MLRKLGYYVPGSVLILLGILIVAVPELLVALVAATLITIGIGVLYAAHHVRKLHEEFGKLEDEAFFGDGFYDPFVNFERAFFGRLW